jgi:N-acetylneuraminic acid mutarotase
VTRASCPCAHRQHGQDVRVTLGVLLLLFTFCANAFADVKWTQLPPLPDPEGFAGAYAGVTGGALILAGGANFPDKKPWEGGKKVWYDRVFVLDRPDGTWKRVGPLPRPLGYGVSVTHRDAILCVGGSDVDRHYADAFRIEKQGNKFITTPLPSLPKPIANMCGALVGDRLLIAGGQATPSATTAFATLFELDLSANKPAWRELKPCPADGRILAVAAAVGDDFYFIGGASLSAGKDGKAERRYLKDAWRYRAGAWERLPDLPHPVVAAPSPAPVDARGGILILGGDDGSQVGVTPPEGHKGFARSILRFDVATSTWQQAGEIPAPRVTAPCVRWNDAWVVPSGEALPGVRSPQVWSFVEAEKDQH